MLLMSSLTGVWRGSVAASLCCCDGMIIAMSISDSNTYCYLVIAFSIKWLIAEVIFFIKIACYAHKNIKEGMVMGLGMDMGRDELLEDRAAFIAGEIGGAVVELIIGGVVISRDAIVDSLEAKRKAVGNVIHKGLLRDAAEFVRKGQ